MKHIFEISFKTFANCKHNCNHNCNHNSQNLKWFIFFRNYIYINNTQAQIRHYLRNKIINIKFKDINNTIINANLKLLNTKKFIYLYNLFLSKISHFRNNKIYFILNNEEYINFESFFNFEDDYFEFNNKIKDKKANIKVKIIKEKNRFKSRYSQFIINNDFNINNIKEFMLRVRKAVLIKIEKYRRKHNNVKVNLNLNCAYINKRNDVFYHNFQTKNLIFLNSSNKYDLYDDFIEQILNRHENLSDENIGSDWVLESINYLNININRLELIGGSSYIELPDHIKNKKAIINVKNEDQRCFLYTIASYIINAKDNPHRPSIYNNLTNNLEKCLNKKINFPVKHNENEFKKIIKLINNSNILDYKISIGVYNLIKKKIYPSYIPKEICDKHIDILFFTKRNKSHYCWIKNLSKLIVNQYNKDEHKIYICRKCFTKKTTIEKLKEHILYCNSNEPVKVNMPNIYNNNLYFNKYYTQNEIPFAIYADFEAIIKKFKKEDLLKTSIIKESEHKAITNVLYIKHNNKINYKEKTNFKFFGEDCAKQFFNKLKEICINIHKNYLSKFNNYQLNKDELIIFNKSDICEICDKKINENPKILDKELENNKKIIKKIYYYLKQNRQVNKIFLTKIEEINKKIININNQIEYNKIEKNYYRDRITGEYKGTCHLICKEELNKNINFIPIYFHNLSGYDAHLLIKEFGNDFDDIKVIPKTDEKYISFSKIVKYNINKKVELRFLDSFKFLPNSLSNISKILKYNDFSELKKWFNNYLNKDKFKGLQTEIKKNMFRLIRKKLSYPYDYMDNINKYYEKNLPDKINFYNKLTKENISNKEYRNTKKIWDLFKIENMLEFTLLYNNIDVLLLTDIFENFRKLSLKEYKLDPCWYYTTPSLAWSAMLKNTDINLELLTNYDMLMMFENGKRGGISQCSNRFSRANNKYMGKKYKIFNKSSFIQYIDANNLYGGGMSRYLPYANFKWENPKYFNYNKIIKFNDKIKTGYIFDVDLEYPKELHDYHKDLPYCPENIINNKKTTKLFTTLYDKNNYIIHYSNLKQALESGLKLKKINRVISFSQLDWMKVYIDKNTNLRKKSKTDFEKDFFKLMNNSVFGKTMMNIRNHINVKLISEGGKYTKYVSKNNYNKSVFFDDNLAAIHLTKIEIFFNQPIYIGVCILELSKTIIYDFFYKLKKIYNDKIKLLYCDTDSLIIEVFTDDIFEDMKDNINYYDTSDIKFNKDQIKINNTLKDFPKVNKKVLNKFKDEMNGKIIEEFIGLSSKMYSIKIYNKINEINKAKGVKKNVIKHENYKKCLFNKKILIIEQNNIISEKHKLYTINQKKIGLSYFDDKRIFTDTCWSATLPWGYYKSEINIQNFHDHLKKLKIKRL